jgi:hypothetical protein
MRHGDQLGLGPWRLNVAFLNAATPVNVASPNRAARESCLSNHP